MAAGAELVKRVQRLVVDPTSDEDEILSLINQGLYSLSAQLRLPELEAYAQVSTVLDTYSADLPANYQHGLFRAYNGVSTMPITITSSLAEIIEKTGDLTDNGDVMLVAARGTKLLYHPVPSEVATLTIYYYRLPSLYTNSTSTDAFHPQIAVHGENALCYYAAWQLYEPIEDGIEGDKVNSDRYRLLFYRTIEDMGLLIREGVSHPRPPITRPSW